MEHPHDQEIQKIADELKVTLKEYLLDSAEFAAAARCSINAKFQESDLI